MLQGFFGCQLSKKDKRCDIHYKTGSIIGDIAENKQEGRICRRRRDDRPLNGGIGNCRGTSGRSIGEYLTGEPAEEESLYKGFVKRSKGCLTHTEAVKPNILPKEERSADREDDRGLDFEAVRREAHRCFNCSCFAVNPSDLETALMAMKAVIHTNKKATVQTNFLPGHQR